jgi:hypothetical protein
MITEADVVAARDLALQKVGRNVVNFQKMEGMLRFIFTFANISAPASDAASYLERQQRLVRTRPMGELLKMAFRAIASEPLPAPPDIKEMWISHSFSFGGGEADAKEWRLQMRRIVRERNVLIHHMLASFNPKSMESCAFLSAELDAQRERMLPAYKGLEDMVVAIRNTHEYMANNIDEIVSGIMAARAPHDA